jgi:hypothetical protein
VAKATTKPVAVARVAAVVVPPLEPSTPTGEEVIGGLVGVAAAATVLVKVAEGGKAVVVEVEVRESCQAVMVVMGTQRHRV